MAQAPKKNQLRNKDLEEYAGDKKRKSGAGKPLKSGKGVSKGRDKKISNSVKDGRKDGGMKNPRGGQYKGNIPGGDMLSQQLNAGMGQSPDMAAQVLAQILGQGGAPTGPVAGPSPQLQQQVLQSMGESAGPSPAAMEMFVERYGREPASEKDMIILQNLANEIGE